MQNKASALEHSSIRSKAQNTSNIRRSTTLLFLKILQGFNTSDPLRALVCSLIFLKLWV